jgi:ribosomal protein S18 acetylase RimI-like enzyme
MGEDDMAIKAPMRCRPIGLTMVDGFLDGPDVDRAYEVVSESDFAMIGRVESSRESLRFQIASPDAARDEHRLVEGDDGEPVGVLVIERDNAARLVFADAYCLPGMETDVLAPLAAMGIAAGGRLSEGEPGWQMEAGALVNDVAACAVLEASGYRPVRRFWQMGIDLAGYPLAEPEAPAGVTRSVAASEGDRRLLHSIHESAFAEHFGSVARPYEQWLAWHKDRQDAAPDLWWLAWLDGEPVAEITQDHSRDGVNAAYVRSLGVAPNARGLGIGRWLLQCAFAEAARRGREQACLTVDSDNTTGATALYESAGMASEVVIDLFRRPLGASG